MQKKVMFLKLSNSLKNKKSQAAMEFLMTYGWAILIVLVAIAALYFLGVFSGKTANSCTLEPPFNCIDSKSIGTSIVLQVGSLNSVKDVAPGDVTITVNGVACTSTTFSTVTLRSGGRTDITCSHGLAKDEKFNGEISITYGNKVGLSGKAAKGTISGQIQ
ncbi:hypothetical protein HY500_01585 [Candidatus Woesearchaeota archaeon]|nr:hypothetical protein [Candidatus Woesearchaeota archaeon]